MRSIEARGCVLACILTACWLLPYSETYGSEGSISEPSAKATDSESFQPTELRVPEGFHVELAAGPPLVTHPTMACFDDQGRLYVCNNAGVNMGNEELEEHLPNAIHRLVDTDGDGKFDSFTVFADKLTFPMGGAWHDGAVYVASPPNIWRLRDTDGDGVADERIILVSRFGYNGNAASIHGCFFGPDGRLYWTDGYHGHEFKDPQGNVSSSREGSYLFSCRSDGSDTRIHCGGGMDNPVEVDFTDSGDMLGTVNILYSRPREDCFVHWLHGGAYPHRVQVLNEHKSTGEFLTPVHSFGHVAVSGITRYRSHALDGNWDDHWFTTFFNSGKVVRLSLERQGATYTATQHEFLTSPSREFHPTDVLEDADGSLLVIDTGGWFYKGCPTSQYAKPDVLGGIYRIRRDTAATTSDPRGLQIDWDELQPYALVKLFSDSRFAVRERAIAECVQRGASVLEPLADALSSGDVLVRTNCVWALTRLMQQSELAEAASRALRPALSDAVTDVRQAACHGYARSISHLETAWIAPLLNDTEPAVRRQAAATLGMQDCVEAIPQLVGALDREGLERAEEHAIIYALIEMGDAAAIRSAWQALASGTMSMQQWRGMAIALDQIDGGDIQWNEVEFGLDSNDATSRQVAARIAKRHPEWLASIANKLASWLASGHWKDRSETIEGLLSGSLHDSQVAAMAGGFLDAQQPAEVRALILRAMARGSSVDPHPSWLEPLERQLASSDEVLVRQAIAAVVALRGSALANSLSEIARDDSRSYALRVDALAALARQAGKLEDSALDELIEIYSDSGSPAASRRAAQVLGESNSSNPQKLLIAPLLSKAPPAELRDFVGAFRRVTDHDVAQAFLSSISSNPALLSLAEHELFDVFNHFPPELLGEANKLLEQLKQHEQHKLVRLQGLRDKLAQGNAARGKTVFASEKSKCSTCHRVADQGLRVGPDLTTIGLNRSADDLLESILFPSASIVRDYDPYKIMTVDGRVLSGIIVGETQAAIEVQQASGEKLKLPRDDIEQIAPSEVSIMPAGLEEVLSEADLLDVVTYLQSLK
jgi:putative membrane-bound dehydrogenase-like protein